MHFTTVCAAFEKIEALSARTAITQELANLLAQASPQEAASIAYLALGALYPPYKECQFGIAAKTMHAAVARVLDQTVSDVTRQVEKVGDIGLVLAQYTWEPVGQHVHTVTQVYQALEGLLKLKGQGSVASKEGAVAQLLMSLDPLGAKFAARIIVGTLRLGFSDMTLLDAFSLLVAGDKSARQEIEDAYNCCADIGLLAMRLREDGLAGIKQFSLRPGIPMRPAAAERLSDAAAIIKKLGHCVAQPKLDGFRVQVHVEKKQGHKPLVRLFSRNLHDMTHMFPELLEAVEQLDVTSLIAEGEAIGYEQATGNFLPFQETVTRKRKHQVEQAAQQVPLKLFLFDLLYLHGESQIDQPHHTRRARLKKIVPADDERIELVEERELDTAKQLEDYFGDCLHQGLEGLVVKRPDAPYQPGKRNFNWIKLKGDLFGALSDTIDCVIVGYYRGQGKRAKFGIGALLVALYDQEHDTFPTIAKLGTGLTDEGWIAIKQACDQLVTHEQPKQVLCDARLAPDVWVQPKLVCEVRADQMTLSPLHAAGLKEAGRGIALRFPRFVKLRDDKTPADATSVKEALALFKGQHEGKRSKK